MNKETLGSRILTIVDNFVINNAMIFIGVFCFLVILAELYYHYFRVCKTNDGLDIGKQYVKLEMLRRYRL